MFIIKKEFHFSASHRLIGLPDTHPCSRVHGHNYVVTVTLQSKQVNAVGFVTDYRELEPIKRYIDSTLDHQHLNDCFPHQPSAELMAKSLFWHFRDVLGFTNITSVEVKETDKTTAIYTPVIV